MADRPEILTAEYLSQLSPNDRSAAIRERMVTDEKANPELLAWARAQYLKMLESGTIGSADRLRPMTAITHQRRLVPVDEWRRTQVPEGWKAELIGGEVVVTPAPTSGHAIIATLLAAAFTAGEVPAGYIVLTSAVEWEIPVGSHMLTGTPQPDVVVMERVDIKRLTQAPLLAAEVLSPSDRGAHESGLTRIEAKRVDYATGGLADYIEVDRAGGNLVVRRYELHDGELRVVDTASSDGRIETDRPFPYVIRVADLQP